MPVCKHHSLQCSLGLHGISCEGGAEELGWWQPAPRASHLNLCWLGVVRLARRNTTACGNAAGPKSQKRVLHDWVLQVKDLMRVLKTPFEEQPGAEKYRVAAPKEIRMGVELLSCSS